METFVLAWFGVGLIIGFFCAFIAQEKNRSGGWFVLGLLFGIFALIAIAAHDTCYLWSGARSGSVRWDPERIFGRRVGRSSEGISVLRLGA